MKWARWATLVCAMVAMGATAHGQTQTQQNLWPAKPQFSDNNGAPLAGGSASFYVPNTLTPKTTYQDPFGSVLNPTSVPLDSGGRAFVYGSGLYRMILQDVNGNTVYDGLTGTAFPSMLGSNNLSDLTSITTALSNLGLGCPVSHGPNLNTPGQFIGVFATCFGVKADGVTDDTAAWNSAVAYMNSNANTVIIASPGTSLISSLNAITATNGTISCPQGQAQCILSLSGNPGITYTGARGGGLNNVQIANRGVACAVSALVQNGTLGIQLNNVMMANNIGTLLQVGSGSGSNVGNILVNNLTVQGGSNSLISTSACPIINVLGPGGGLGILNSNAGTAGGSVAGRDFIDLPMVGPNFWDQLLIENSQIGPFNKFINAQLSGALPLLLDVVVQGNFVLNCQSRCVDMGGTGTISVVNIANNWMDGNATADICVNIGGPGVQLIRVNNNYINNCNGSGLIIGTVGQTTRSVQVIGNTLALLNVGATGSSFGIEVQGSGNGGVFNNVQVIGNSVSPPGISGTKPDTGISISSSPGGGAGAKDFQLINNQAQSNTTNYVWPSGSSDVGIVTNNTDLAAANAAVAPGASPFTFTAGARPTTVYLTGGVVSAVAANGGAVACTTSPCAVQLGSNESMTITYTGAPTMWTVLH